MNLASIIIVIFIALAFMAAVGFMWRRHGTGCCGGGCSGNCSACKGSGRAYRKKIAKMPCKIKKIVG